MMTYLLKSFQGRMKVSPIIKTQLRSYFFYYPKLNHSGWH